MPKNPKQHQVPAVQGPGLATSRRQWCAAVLSALATMDAGAQDQGKTIRVGPDRQLTSLQAALRVANTADVIELDPGEYRGDVGVVDVPRLTIRSRGTGAVLHADGQHAEGKAMLVVRGDVVIENLEFRGARVPVGNGAGIRFERGRLAVRRCRFFDNEMGILTASEPSMQLDVVDCDFGAAPQHEGMLHHLLYVGAIGRWCKIGRAHV